MPAFTVVLGTTTAAIKEDLFVAGPSGLMSVNKTTLPWQIEALTGPGQLVRSKPGVQHYRASIQTTQFGTDVNRYVHYFGEREQHSDHSS